MPTTNVTEEEYAHKPPLSLKFSVSLDCNTLILLIIFSNLPYLYLKFFVPLNYNNTAKG